jgi:hypothetical protein
MRLLQSCWLVIAFLAVSACKNLPGDIPRHTSIIPRGKINILPQYSITYANLVQVGLMLGAVYYITDPTAPSWEIIETRLPDNRVTYRLYKQYLSLGGDGEGRYILSQRAEALAREQGMAGYRIERYEEAVDNRIFFPRRGAYAEISLLLAKPGG